MTFPTRKVAQKFAQAGAIRFQSSALGKSLTYKFQEVHASFARLKTCEKQQTIAGQATEDATYESVMQGFPT